jgi:hypothetical protein
MLGLPGCPPREILPVCSLFFGLFLLRLLLAAPQPLAAGARIDKLGRQLIAARLAQALVLGGIRPHSLGEHPLDLPTDRAVAARRLRRSASRLPSSATTPTEASPAFAQSASTCTNIAASARSCRARKRATVA